MVQPVVVAANFSIVRPPPHPTSRIFKLTSDIHVTEPPVGNAFVPLGTDFDLLLLVVEREGVAKIDHLRVNTGIIKGLESVGEMVKHIGDGDRFVTAQGNSYPGPGIHGKIELCGEYGWDVSAEIEEANTGTDERLYPTPRQQQELQTQGIGSGTIGKLGTGKRRHTPAQRKRSKYRLGQKGRRNDFRSVAEDKSVIAGEHPAIANTEKTEMAIEGLSIEIAIGEGHSAKCRERISSRGVVWRLAIQDGCIDEKHQCQKRARGEGKDKHLHLWVRIDTEMRACEKRLRYLGNDCGTASAEALTYIILSVFSA